MREIVQVQVGQCGNQIGSKVNYIVTVKNHFYHIFKTILKNPIHVENILRNIHNVVSLVLGNHF